MDADKSAVLWALVSAALILAVLLLSGCATTFVTSSAEVLNEDGVPERMAQRAVTMAWGKSMAQGSRPNATFTWLDDGSGEMSASGEVDKLTSDNDMVKMIESVGKIYAQAMAAGAASAAAPGLGEVLGGALLGGGAR